MAHADESRGLEVGREIMPDGMGRIDTENSSGLERPESPPPVSAAHWTGPLPSSGCGVMAVIGDDGYLIPLWTAGDMLRACKVYWHSINS